MEFDFGTRKAQCNNGGLFVIIPKLWVRACRLKKGDELHIQSHGQDSLLISVARDDEAV